MSEKDQSVENPKWTNGNEDPDLIAAFKKADQVSGDGVNDLLHQMIRVEEKNGATRFAFSTGESQKAIKR